MQPCPRQRDEATLSVQLAHRSHWEDDGTCSYCGSLSPQQFFAAVELEVELGPTDKNYKVYVHLKEEERKRSPLLRKVPPYPKFYFQHLSDEEKTKFVKLLNEKKVKIGMPGYFYRLPFFVVVEDKK